MKKTMIILTCAIASLLINSGCTTTSGTNPQKVYNAGYTAALVYAAKALPSDETKENIAETITFVTSTVDNSTNVTSYSQLLTPVVNDFITKSTTIKAEDKPLVRIASLYMLTSVDGLIARVDTSKVTTNTGYLYLTEFSRGFIDGLAICDSGSDVGYILQNSNKIK